MHPSARRADTAEAQWTRKLILFVSVGGHETPSNGPAPPLEISIFIINARPYICPNKCRNKRKRARAIPTPRAFSDVEGPPHHDLSRVVKLNPRPVVDQPPFLFVDSINLPNFFPVFPSSPPPSIISFLSRIRAVSLYGMKIYLCVQSSISFHCKSLRKIFP